MTHAKRLLALTMTLALVTPSVTATTNPARESIEAREAALFPTSVRRVRSAKGVIAGTASPIAVEAGAQVLREGGTAADAAVTTALLQITATLDAVILRAAKGAIQPK